MKTLIIHQQRLLEEQIMKNIEKEIRKQKKNVDTGMSQFKEFIEKEKSKIDY